MQVRTLAPGCVVIVALAGACSEDLPSPAAVTSLRLLALTTPTPEVLPGNTLGVRATVYDPTAGRPLWFHWRLCPEPASGDARDCALPTAGRDLDVSLSDQVTLPAEGLSLPPGADHQDWLVYLALCPGAPSVFDPALGHYRCASPEGIEAVRTVTVRAAPPLNHNPGITAAWLGDGAARVTLASDGSAPTVAGCPTPPCTAVSFGMQPAPDAAEALPDGGTESLEASFYATLGTIDPPRVLANPGAVDALVARWTPPGGEAPGSAVHLWIVLRDQRGGDTVAGATVTLR